MHLQCTRSVHPVTVSTECKLHWPCSVDCNYTVFLASCRHRWRQASFSDGNHHDFPDSRLFLLHFGFQWLGLERNSPTDNLKKYDNSTKIWTNSKNCTKLAWKLYNTPFSPSHVQTFPAEHVACPQSSSISVSLPHLLPARSLQHFPEHLTLPPQLPVQKININ